jgi:CRP-like cAMP-binding protein
MIMQTMTDQITQTLRSLVSDFPEGEIAHFLAICKPVVLGQNEYFIPAGQTPRRFGFLKKGLVRYLYIGDDGREYTKAFLAENSFVSSYTAMKSGTPSPFSIQALIQTELIAVDYEQWKKLAQNHEAWSRFLIALLEKGYAIKEKRERDLLLLDAESRYRIFREEFQYLEADIKQHLIASYIGITPIALSRIRRKMGLINLG